MKTRDIMYASHRDSCILGRYAFELTAALDAIYFDSNLSENVIGYRKLGKANYHFSAEAQKFARDHSPCVVIGYDISSFFNNLDHSILKSRLKSALDVTELSNDWYAVLRHVTKYRYVELADLKENITFGPRFRLPQCKLVCTVEELKNEKIQIRRNTKTFGIPQGTPISAALANLYLIELDRKMSELCSQLGALYRRYSDDILVVCAEHHEATIIEAFQSALEEHKLKLSEHKTERVLFSTTNKEEIQYLGFYISENEAIIRSNSLSRQWRKLRRAVRRAKQMGDVAIAAGLSSKVFTKKLRRRFSAAHDQNFSSYARRSASELNSKRILRQVRRFEFIADRAIRELNPPTNG